MALPEAQGPVPAAMVTLGFDSAVTIEAAPPGTDHQTTVALAEVADAMLQKGH